VETDEQLELLRKIGCDQVQGFLVAPPALAEDVPELLQRLRSPVARTKRAASTRTTDRARGVFTPRAAARTGLR